MVRIKAKTKKVFTTLLRWVFILFLAYLIFELIRTMLGGSLGFEELVIGLLIANLGYSFYLRESVNKIDSKISGYIGWHRGRNNKSYKKQ
ncbi:MAG TPA: hypothetical protein ENL16_03115 [Candidatus Woesearchaeota archaeon]|nr:hypothetical protein [Candidatus Woesearchaeota archaeon]